MKNISLRKMFSQKNIPLLFNDDRKAHGNIAFDAALLILILLSTLLFVVQTYHTDPRVLFLANLLDTFIILLFTLEIALRVTFARKRTSYFFSTQNIIDLLAIVPYWIGFPSFQFLRILRFLKMFRILDRFVENHPNQTEVRRATLLFKMVVTFAMLIYISSSMIFLFEHEVNDGIQTYGDAAYLAIATVTTVGYGDVTAITSEGRLVIVITIMLGIFLIPLYIGSLFRLYLRANTKRPHTCKKCGLRYHDANAVHCKMCGETIYQEFDDIHS